MATNLRSEEVLAGGGLDPARVGATAAFRVPGQSSWFSRHEGGVVGAVSVIVFFGVWEWVASARLVSALFLPGPIDIFIAYRALIREGKIWNDIWVSGEEL